MPMAAYFVSKLLTTMLFALIVVLLMSALASEFGGVRLAPAQWLALVAALVVGSIPFAALGLAMGFIAGPNSAPAIVNVIYLPLSFLSGLWIPVEALPPVIAHIAPFLPTYHLGQLALGTIGSGHGSALTHIAILVLWTIAGVAAAAYGMKRDEGRTYG
jgi:ABC-2 type transport system permease protein